MCAHSGSALGVGEKKCHPHPWFALPPIGRFPHVCLQPSLHAVAQTQISSRHLRGSQSQTGLIIPSTFTSTLSRSDRPPSRCQVPQSPSYPNRRPESVLHSFPALSESVTTPFPLYHAALSSLPCLLSLRLLSPSHALLIPNAPKHSSAGGRQVPSALQTVCRLPPVLADVR